ncbi:hypothetical protein LEP1GSC038_1801 [Leptospira weilii str. 2006001855]|uniref:Uncharacterized protein n=1 Tax=Leptospira weilii str. 2006001855 TaxID=996804 RepID=M6FC42_9LEPT|nr:hypothetical protein LEP1GSC038_1801 [Leptospira weilii str. 2006001855]
MRSETKTAKGVVYDKRFNKRRHKKRRFLGKIKSSKGI